MCYGKREAFHWRHGTATHTLMSTDQQQLSTDFILFILCYGQHRQLFVGA